MIDLNKHPRVLDPALALYLAREVNTAYSTPSYRNSNAQIKIDFLGECWLISVPGTNDAQDFFQDVDLFPVSRGWAFGNVCNGYADHVGLLEAHTLERLNEHSHAPVIVNGHSLGGIVAKYLAGFLAFLGHPIHMVYTFAAPKGWYVSSRDHYESLKIPTFSIVNGGDPVPRLGLEAGPVFHDRNQYLLKDGKIEPFTEGWGAGLDFSWHLLEGENGYIKHLGECK